MKCDLDSLCCAFYEMADRAADLSLKYFRVPLPVETKADLSPVTIADREIESLLREYIADKFPSHGVIGEEYGNDRSDAEFVWVFDPIDGTKSYISGIPLFGTIIGLLHEGVPVAGLIDQPFTKERWFGIADQKCLYNGKEVCVSTVEALNQARCAVYLPGPSDPSAMQDLRFFERRVRSIRYNMDCYPYALLSMGCMDIVVEDGLQLHDIAGIVPIVTGAGGIMRGINNSAIKQGVMGPVLAASTERLYCEATRAIEASTK